MHLLVQCITMFEILVFVHWRLRSQDTGDADGVPVIMHWVRGCAQVLSATLGDDDCLVVFAVGAGLADSSRINERPEKHLFCYVPLETALTVPRDS